MKNQKQQPAQVSVEVLESVNGGVAQRCVDPRELHSALGVMTPFHKWIVRKIEEFGFEKESDFWTYQSENTGERGRPSREYYIAVDMAKELCMLERSDIGRATRKYFIECERKLMRASSVTPTQESALGKQLISCIEKLKKADNQFEEKIYSSRIERLCLQLKMPQPPIELLEVKKEKKAS